MKSVNVYFHQSLGKQHQLSKQLLGRLVYKDAITYLELNNKFLQHAVNEVLNNLRREYIDGVKSKVLGRKL